jgi:hypothetical protein
MTNNSPSTPSNDQLRLSPPIPRARTFTIHSFGRVASLPSPSTPALCSVLGTQANASTFYGRGAYCPAEDIHQLLLTVDS